MELSEAKEILKDMKESMEQSKKDITIDSILKALEDSVKAIDTILKALDNSISNEQHDLIVKALNDMIEFLKSKLDNSISKDEVRNLDVIDISGFECVALEDIRELLGEE